MALKHLLLGFIHQKASSGYSLHKRIFEPIQPTLSQIYRALNDMAAEGLVDFDRVEQKKLPARNVFYITGAGLEELRRWIRERGELSPIREPFLQLLWFGSVVDKEDVIAKIQTYIDSKKIESQYYEVEATKSTQGVRKTRVSKLTKLYRELVFDYVRLRISTELGWAEAAKQRISGFLEESVSRTSGPSKRKQM